MIAETIKFFRGLSKPLGRAFWWPGRTTDRSDAPGVLLISFAEIDPKVRERLLSRYSHYRRQILSDSPRPSGPVHDRDGPDSLANSAYRLAVFLVRTVMFAKKLYQKKLTWAAHLCESDGLARTHQGIMWGLPYLHLGDLRGTRWRDIRHLERLVKTLEHRRYECWFIFRDRLEAFVPNSLAFPGEPLSVKEIEELAQYRGEPYANVSGVKSLPPEDGVFRVMTYNVHSCIGLDGRLSVRRIAEVLERYSPHFVALQELDFSCRRSSSVDQLRRLTKLWPAEAFFQPTMRRGGGYYGIGCLSRLPVLEWEGRTFTELKTSVPVEPRAVVLAKVELPNKTVTTLVNTHLGLTRKERSSQVDELISLCEGQSEPLVLMGDLNCPPRSREYRQLLDKLTPTSQWPLKTWFGSNPVRILDYTLYKGDLKVRKTFVPIDSLTKVASDHLPLIVDFEL